MNHILPALRSLYTVGTGGTDSTRIENPRNSGSLLQSQSTTWMPISAEAATRSGRERGQMTDTCPLAVWLIPQRLQDSAAEAVRSKRLLESLSPLCCRHHFVVDIHTLRLWMREEIFTETDRALADGLQTVIDGEDNAAEVRNHSRR